MYQQNPQPIQELNEIVHFAVTNFRNQQTKFGIKTDDRRRHMYAIGKTGMGKSTLLENMVIQDIRMGHGVAYLDPHGDTIEKLLNYIPSERINDVVYFNPADIEYPIAFNILESVDDPQEKNLVASGLIGVFKKLWADSWGPRLEYLLRNAILALLDYPGATLLGVTKIMIDKEYRKKVVQKVKDPVIKAFWTQEYTKYSNQFQVEAISPIQNKVGQFLSMAMIRNIVGQVKSALDIRQIMDDRKILLLNLSKGRIGEDASRLLGATMITKIQLAAMSRVNIPEEARQDFYLYVDEFQNFATDSFAGILSEARKYRLSLILAHQYIEQLDETVRAAVFGNVGTLITFRVGAADAEELTKEFSPTFTETDLVNLAKYDLYLKLMIDGVTSDPFSAKGLLPIISGQPAGNQEKIIKVSRERYASAREVIEDKIARWSGVIDDEPNIDTTKEKKQKSKETKGTSQPGKQTKAVEGFKSQCSNCHKDTITKFAPDGVRPVFCADCLKLFKEGKLDRSQFAKSKTTASVTQTADVAQGDSIPPQPKSFGVPKEALAPTKSKQLSKAEMSLTDALSMGPLNFKGKKITKPVTISKAEDDIAASTPANEAKPDAKTPQSEMPPPSASFQASTPSQAAQSVADQKDPQDHTMKPGEIVEL